MDLQENIALNNTSYGVSPAVRWIKLGILPSFWMLGICSNVSFLYILRACRTGNAYSIVETTFRQLAAMDVVFLSMFVLQSMTAVLLHDISGLIFVFCLTYQFFEDIAFFSSMLVVTFFSKTLSRSGRGQLSSKGIARFLLVAMTMATTFIPLNLLPIEANLDTGDNDNWGLISGKCSSQSNIISVTSFGSRALLYFVILTVCIVYWTKSVMMIRRSRRQPKVSTDTPIGRLRHLVRKHRHQNTEKCSAIVYCVIYFLSWLPLSCLRLTAASFVMSSHAGDLPSVSQNLIYILIGAQTVVLASSALRPLLVPLLWKRYRDVSIDDDRLHSHISMVPPGGSPRLHQARRPTEPGRPSNRGRFSPRSPVYRAVPRSHQIYKFSFENN